MQKELTHEIILEPRFLGPHLMDHLRRQLHQQVEGTCSGRHGYIVAIVTVDGVERGRVEDSGGRVCFSVRYTAILLRPFKQEVVEGLVETVNKMGFFAQVGALQVFVSTHVMPVFNI